MAKRGSLESYFSLNNDQPALKKPKLDRKESPSLPSSPAKHTPLHVKEHSSIRDEDKDNEVRILENLWSIHSTYPQAVPPFPESFCTSVLARADSGIDSGIPKVKLLNNSPHLDCVLYEQFFTRKEADDFFEFLRSELFFYKVKYKIKRGGAEVDINTPRYTTVFGVDDSAKFSSKRTTSDNAENVNDLSSISDQAISERELVDANTDRSFSWNARYKKPPRPIPSCLAALQKTTERITGCSFNFCLVNYYASGQDSISYHSDDESFLGPNPAIASFSLGVTRDFCLRHKSATDPKKPEGETIKIPLESGDMILMRGTTQKHWLHSIPKRSDRNKAPGKHSGRINITFRKAITRGGTDNYYRYNVGDGPAYQWDRGKEQMRVMDPHE